MLRSKDMASANDPALSDGLWLSSISLSSAIVIVEMKDIHIPCTVLVTVRLDRMTLEQATTTISFGNEETRGSHHRM